MEGPTVTVRGRVQMRDYRQGNLRIDIFDGDQLQFSGPRPSVVSVITMDQPGTFEVQLPVSAGRVWISCFNDENGDGRPSPMDPVGYFEGNLSRSREATWETCCWS